MLSRVEPSLLKQIPGWSDMHRLSRLYLLELRLSDCYLLVSVKSVQSALSDLLTASATHGTFSRPSTKRGVILIGLELNTNAKESFEDC